MWVCTYARDHACGRAPGEKGQVRRSAMSTAAIAKKYMNEFQRERGVGWTQGKVRARAASTASAHGPFDVPRMFALRPRPMPAVDS